MLQQEIVKIKGEVYDGQYWPDEGENENCSERKVKPIRDLLMRIPRKVMQDC